MKLGLCFRRVEVGRKSAVASSMGKTDLVVSLTLHIYTLFEWDGSMLGGSALADDFHCLKESIGKPYRTAFRGATM